MDSLSVLWDMGTKRRASQADRGLSYLNNAMVAVQNRRSAELFGG